MSSESGKEEMKLNLRIKSKKSQAGVLRDVSTKQKVHEFLQCLSPMTGVPVDQMALLRGFPPKRLPYNGDALLETLGLINQDTLIVEQDPSAGAGGTPSDSGSSMSTVTSISSDSMKVISGPAGTFHGDTSSTSSSTPSSLGSSAASSGLQSQASTSLPVVAVKNQLIINALTSSTVKELAGIPIAGPAPAPRHSQVHMSNSTPVMRSGDVPNGLMMRHVVPSDNSCLFTSVMFCVAGNVPEVEHGTGSRYLREMIATTVKSDPEEYNEAMLGKPNNDYVQWILKNESWGGGIELSIMSNFYSIEMSVLNIQSGQMSRFGEDRNYSHRIFLLYDGIHYDPLFLEPFDGSRDWTVFPTSDEAVLEKALQLVAEAKTAHQFTDLTNFSLRCQQCNTLLKGQTEAQAHAKLTSHTAFAEIKK